METKRSIGVTIFGLLTIAMSLLCLPFLFDAKSAIEPFIKPYGVILYGLSIPLTVFEIVLGVNILKLKEWARKYLVMLTIIYIASIFVIPQLEDKNYERANLQYLRSVLQPGAISDKEGIVFYRINSTSGEPILMRVNYVMPERSIANVSFHLAKQKPDGQYKYEMMSQEGEPITIEFWIKNGTLSNMRLDTAFRPSPEKRQSDTPLTLLSARKERIIFAFSWNNDGSIKNVNVRPAEDKQNFLARQNGKNLSPEQKERMRKFMENLPFLLIKFIKIIFYGSFLIFYALTVFFFTRPKVKEQFK